MQSAVVMARATGGAMVGAEAPEGLEQRIGLGGGAG